MPWPKAFENTNTLLTAAIALSTMVASLVAVAFFIFNIISTTTNNKLDLQRHEALIEEMHKEITQLQQNISIQDSLALSAKLTSDEAILSKLREDNAVAISKLSEIRETLRRVEDRLDGKK